MSCSVCALLHSRHSGVGRGAAAACDIVCKLVHMCILFVSFLEHAILSRVWSLLT